MKAGEDWQHAHVGPPVLENSLQKALPRKLCGGITLLYYDEFFFPSPQKEKLLPCINLIST